MTRAAGPAVSHALQLFLRKLQNHSTLGENEQAAILGLQGEARIFAPSQDLLHPGEMTDRACLVATGLAGRFSEMIDDRRQISALYLPGDMGNLHSLVRPRADQTLRALTMSTIIEIGHVDLLRLKARHPQVADAFWRDCELESSRLTRWIVNCGRRDSATRLAHLLCEMAVRSEMAGLGTVEHFALPMNQTQIAETLGLTAVHVNRVLQKLRREDLVNYRGGSVNVPNWQRLAARAEFSPEYLH